MLDIPKKSWEVITAADLEAAKPGVKDGDIVVIVTGWHHNYSDGLEYYGEAPGPHQGRGRVARLEEPEVRGHRHAVHRRPAGDLHGPASRRPAHEAPRRSSTRPPPAATPRTTSRSGSSPHKTLAAAGIPTVEQVGGDVDLVKGKRATLAATPWKFEHGDACQVRMVAMFDPSGKLPHRRRQLITRGAERNRDMSLKIYDLSHTFTQFMPGVAVHPERERQGRPSSTPRTASTRREWEGIMHRCTHMDAPLHVTENTPTIADYPLWRLFGTGVCVAIPKEKWGVITPEDLENATPKIEEGDIVIINTGFHRLWGDTDEYFAYGCGMGAEGAQWLVDKKVKMVAYGHQANDHPIATKLVDHGLGPTQPHLIDEYKDEHRPRPQGRLPELGAGAQDPHGPGRHPRHRERRRRPGRGHRQALHLHRAAVALAGRRRLHGPHPRGHRPRPDLPLRDRAVT